MYKILQVLPLLLMTVFPILISAQSASGGAAAGAGAAGGSGGSNVYGFRYILFSDRKDPYKGKGLNSKVDSSNTLKAAYLDSASENQDYYSGNYYRMLFSLQQFARKAMLILFKVDRADSVDSHHNSISTKIAKNQFTLGPTVNDTNWIYTNVNTDTILTKRHRVLYNYIVPTHRLSIFLLGRDQDTVMFEVWPPNKSLQNSAYDSAYTVIEGVQNVKLYNHYKFSSTGQVTYTRQADTFYFVPHWRNQGVGPRFQTFNLMFSTKYLIPVSIPLIYNFKAKATLANFLNAGMAYGWGLGRTKFYRDAIQSSRNFYIGAGFLGGVSTATISASTVNDSTLKASLGSASSTLPEVYYGCHVGISFSSVQFIISGS
jgi:hypothetical protein